ncbi:MAG: ubiquinol-cytochrome C chaperone family protein [Flavobacteriaceae bacterium]
MRAPEPPRQLYEAIVAQARQPVFYTDFGVADDVEGRFEMIVMHLVLVLDRTQQLGEPGRIAGQALFDLFFRDMDRSLREMGTGDLAVPKRIRRMAENVYGRADVYRAALSGDDVHALQSAIERNVRPAGAGAADRLAAYMRENWQALQSHDLDALIDGEVAWVSPRAAAPV